MDISKINTYGDAPERAFETFCSQLFISWLRETYEQNLNYCSIVNGKGGDGGVEAYGVLNNKQVIGLQCKWFVGAIDVGQVNQIRKSVVTARKVRATLSLYIICLPRNVASLKSGKGKKNIKNFEEKKLLDLKKELETQHTGLEIRYWFEDQLIVEVQKATNEGVARFWIGSEFITFDRLKFSFELAKDTWLKERYTPVSLSGGIDKVIDEIMLTPRFIGQEIKELSKIIDRITSCEEYIKEYVKLNVYFPKLNKAFLDTKIKLTKFKRNLKVILKNLELGLLNAPIQVPDEIELYPLVEKLMTTPKGNLLRNIIPVLEASLRNLHAMYLRQYVERLIERLSGHNQIILGPVGTGKTHGLARAVDELLTSGIPAIIICAKGTPSGSWADILRFALGGVEWTDFQLFHALEALALRMSVNKAHLEKRKKFKDHSIRLLICIDGVDEADWETWKNRVSECKTYLKKYPLLRFVISSRSYPPDNMNPCDLEYDGNLQRRYDVGSYGDVDLYTLVQQYLKEYNIDYKGNSWVLHSFENATALYLFCDENKNGKISDISEKPVYFTLNKLLKSKIARVELEFIKENPGQVSKNSQIIFKMLIALSDLFLSKGKIEMLPLLESLELDIKPKQTSYILEKALDKITEHAFIQKETVEVPMGPTQYFYSIRIQSYLEFFVASSLVDNIIKNNLKDLPGFLRLEENKNIRYLTAVALLVDHCILIGTDELWTNDFFGNDLILLQYEVLRRSPDHLVRIYLPLIREYFLRSEELRNLTIQYFILPNIDREELNLGFDLVHETLSSFSTVYERDRFWSGPDNRHIDGSSPLSLQLDNEHLHFFHLPYGKPLLMAWALASLDKVFRENVRKEILDWSMFNVEGFLSLLDVMFCCGDPQIQEDLSIVILGMSADMREFGDKAHLLVSWIITNVFAEERIPEFTNSIVRYSLMAFIERAYKQDLCTFEKYSAALSPFKTNSELLVLDYEAQTNYDSREGRYPIQNDLYWNTIKDAYKGFLTYSQSSQLNDAGIEFIKPYDRKYLAEFSAKDFAVSAALTYLKKWGWNKWDGLGGDIGGHQYASYEEKYTLCAVHCIQGFLADRLPYDSDTIWLSDYRRLVSVFNPSEQGIAHYVMNYSDSHMNYHLPEEIAEKLEYDSAKLAQGTRKWVKAAKFPDILRLIKLDKLHLHGKYSCSDSWVTLYSETAVPEIGGLGRARLRVICLLLEADSYPEFVKFIGKKRTFKHSSISPNDFFAGIDGGVYQSLVDVLWMDSIKEYSGDHEFTDDDGIGTEVKTTVTEINEGKLGAGKKTYIVPSELIRESFGVIRTDKRGFFDKSDQLKIVMHSHHESDILYQSMTLADAESFEEMLSKKNLMPIWLVEHFRSTTDVNIIRENNASHQHCKKWIVFSGGLENRQLHSEEHC